MLSAKKILSKNYKFRSFVRSQNKQTRLSSVYMWGQAKGGMLGVENSLLSTPQKIKIPTKSKGINHISFGPTHTAVTTSDGEVFMSGSNVFCQLGLREEINKKHQFGKVDSLKDIKMTVCGGSHTLALDHSGNVFGFGGNGGLLSIGGVGIAQKGNHSTPRKLDFGGEKIKSVQAGQDHAMALSESGKVFSWGCSSNGCLGTMAYNDKQHTGIALPNEVEYFRLFKIDQISVSGMVNAAVTSDRNLYMWGINNKNQLGVEIINIDMQTCETVPVKVKDCDEYDAKISKISLSPERCAAIDVDGRFLEWGKNYSYPTPSQDLDIGEIKTIGVGSDYFAALTECGKFYTWGSKGPIASPDDEMKPKEIEQFKGLKVEKFFAGDKRVAVVVKD